MLQPTSRLLAKREGVLHLVGLESSLLQNRKEEAPELFPYPPMKGALYLAILKTLHPLLKRLGISLKLSSDHFLLQSSDRAHQSRVKHPKNFSNAR